MSQPTISVAQVGSFWYSVQESTRPFQEKAIFVFESICVHSFTRTPWKSHFSLGILFLIPSYHLLVQLKGVA